MIGALIGDIAGSRFEWNNCKSKSFEFFTADCRPTDDSVMTLAVAKAFLDRAGRSLPLAEAAVNAMREFGRRYPFAGYGGRFCDWLTAKEPKPYQSWGNGAAMRVSPCGYAAASLEEAKAFARAVTAVTHDHPEGIRGAESVAAAVYLARAGADKKEIRRMVTADYYPLDFTLDSIRDTYTFDVSCQGSVPQALEAFFEAEDFEDAVRGAVSLGGDSDTIAAIAGGVAGAYFGVPARLREAALPFLDPFQKQTLFAFEAAFGITPGGRV